MFLWCSYCQTFLEEAPPFDDFSVSHGVCDACQDEFLRNPEAYEVTARALAARDLFDSMFSRSGAPNLTDCRRFLERARAAGLNPFDMLIGVLQPALYSVGSKWQRGELTVAQEHAFTAWCEQVLDLFPTTAPTEDYPILLVCARGNRHFLGIRLLSLYLRRHGVQSRDVGHSLSAQEVIRLCRFSHPRVLGISVAMAEAVPASLRWADEIRREVEPETSVVMGGRAFREGRVDAADYPVICTPQAFVDFLSQPQR